MSTIASRGGDASVLSMERVVGCLAMLSTVGTELSSLLAGDSPEASDRAATQIPCCHGDQRNADDIRVSHVSIVADGSISGGAEGEPKKQPLGPEKQRLEMPSEDSESQILPGDCLVKERIIRSS